MHPQSTTTIFEGPICDDQLSTTRENYLPNERTMPITNLFKKRKVDMETNTQSEKHLKKRSSTKRLALFKVGMSGYSNIVKGGLIRY